MHSTDDKIDFQESGRIWAGSESQIESADWLINKSPKFFWLIGFKGRKDINIFVNLIHDLILKSHSIQGVNSCLKAINGLLANGWFGALVLALGPRTEGFLILCKKTG